MRITQAVIEDYLDPHAWKEAEERRSDIQSRIRDAAATFVED